MLRKNAGMAELAKLGHYLTTRVRSDNYAKYQPVQQSFVVSLGPRNVDDPSKKKKITVS